MVICNQQIAIEKRKSTAVRNSKTISCIVEEASGNYLKFEKQQSLNTLQAYKFSKQSQQFIQIQQQNIIILNPTDKQTQEGQIKIWNFLKKLENLQQNEENKKCAIHKMYVKRLNLVKRKGENQEEDLVIIGNQGLRGGSMELHLGGNKKFRIYNINKTWGIPILKLVLGIFTVLFNINDDPFFSTQSIGGFQLLMEGCTDIFREFFESMELPPSIEDIGIATLKKDNKRREIRIKQLIYTLKIGLGQILLIALEVFILIEVIKTAKTLDDLSSIFEMVLIFTAALLCFFENFSQLCVRLFLCKTYHSQNLLFYTQFQFRVKPIFLIAFSMLLCIIFVFGGKKHEQAAFFPTLAVYIISDGINQLKDNDGVVVVRQMKDQKGWFSDISTDQKVHQIALLQDIISFNKYLASFQVITSVLLIMPFRFMDDKYAQAELFVFIFLLLVDSVFNFCDSYWYSRIYKENNQGFKKYMGTLSKYKEEKDKEIEKAKK